MVRAGRGSKHMSYCHDLERQNFDVGLSWYDDGTAEDFGLADGAVFLHDGWEGTRIEANLQMHDECRELFERYDYICFMDDDMIGDAPGVSRMFAVCQTLGLDVAQPAIALGPDSFNNHPITAVHSRFRVRYTNFVEGNAIVLSSHGRERILTSHEAADSLYGIDVVWSHMIALGKMAIVDDTPMIHSRPANKLGFNAEGTEAARRNMIRYSVTGSPLYLTYGGFTTNGEFIAMGGPTLDGSRRVLELLEQASPDILASLHQIDPDLARVRVGKYLAGNRDFVASDPGHRHVDSILREHLASVGIEAEAWNLSRVGEDH